jgi:hypothetical protein
MRTLQALGWNWRKDGVEVCAVLDGHRYTIFVPLRAVYHEFAKEFAAVGAPFDPVVGDFISVEGFFKSLGKAFSSVAKTVAKVATKNPVAKAVNAVTKLALKPVVAITKATTKVLAKVPVFGSALSAASGLLAGPINVANGLASGGRIDKVLMQNLKESISQIKTLAPYIQTVISFVPGIGTGLSAAIGAGLALASGMKITDAILAGVKGALPGGPLAAAAFDVAQAVAQGKPIAQIAINALPIAPAAKQALVQGIQLAKDLASGKKVSQVLIDNALKALPGPAQKAVQVAVALVNAKNLQSAVAGVANAVGVAGMLSKGVAAATQIARLPPGLTVPPALVNAVSKGLQAKQIVSTATRAASQGQPQAAAFLGFLRKPTISGPIHAPFRARIHANPRIGAPLQSPFRARFHTAPSSAPTVSGGIHARFSSVGAPRSRRPFSYAVRAVPQLYPVRMPYQTPSHLFHAWGR